MDRLWELSGVSPAEFFSLADLLTLTNDGQYDPSEVQPLTDSISRPSDRSTRFLDLLAAVFSREKGASHVTAAAMREERVKVGRKGATIVYVARNDGFQDVDRIFKDQLQNMLRLLAKGEAHKRDCHRLWKLMCSHYKARLNSYISDLRRLLDQAHYPPWIQSLRGSRESSSQQCLIWRRAVTLKHSQKVVSFSFRSAS
ncbi:hypothetical protein DL96DRAFT_351806 [Flagelloscypha sp. PMI_526]|nr:hypothetical protein DL96DRAFT_351806 [Flagelloscypha sp. PMI_526]